MDECAERINIIVWSWGEILIRCYGCNFEMRYQLKKDRDAWQFGADIVKKYHPLARMVTMTQGYEGLPKELKTD